MCIRYLDTLVVHFFLSFPRVFLVFFFFALAHARRVERTGKGEKGHPRPEKCSALGGWPLDTTNRYRPFDMDLGTVQPNAKVLPAFVPDTVVVVQYRSRPSQSCFSSFVSLAINKVMVFKYLHFRST